MDPITVVVYPDHWLAQTQTGPLYTNYALEVERVMRSPHSKPAERDEATADYAHVESLQMQLSDAYAEALASTVCDVASALDVNLNNLHVLVWTVDGDPPPEAHPNPLLPQWPDGPTWQEVIGSLAKRAVTVQDRSPWGVSVFGEVVFEL